MTQFELIESVARATGEPVALVDRLGFHLADPLEVSFDPEPRPPLVLDWDTMAPSNWPS
jgi:hypothetical protein